MGFEIEAKNAVRERFLSAGRSPIWSQVPERDWSNWVWQQQKRVKTLEQLAQVIQVTGEERDAFAQSSELFNMAITPYYASLIDPADPNCPIRLQSVPKMGELTVLPTEWEDPLAEEEYLKAPGVTHRYPDRVLFYTTHNCPVYCRHCTRKRKVADPSTSMANRQLDEGLAYIASAKEVRDVLVSGGDPLSNSDERLEYILSRLRAMEHIETIRLCTRNLVTLPQRITDSLARMLSRYNPIFVHTHFNHPRECTLEAFDACAKLADAGCVLQNQMVLLKGVNDDAAIVKELNHKLLLMRVRPYYIFQCDQAREASRLDERHGGAPLRGRLAGRGREDHARARVPRVQRRQEMGVSQLSGEGVRVSRDLRRRIVQVSDRLRDAGSPEGSDRLGPFGAWRLQELAHGYVRILAWSGSFQV